MYSTKKNNKIGSVKFYINHPKKINFLTTDGKSINFKFILV